MTEQTPQPKGLKQIASSQQKNGPPSEGVSSVHVFEAPPVLGPLAREEWDRLTAELLSKGVLSRVDRGPLTAYCIAYGQMMEAVEMVEKHGAMVKSPNGFPQQSPYLSHLNKQIEIMIRIASEFGFTPASRSRIFSFDQKNALLLDGPVANSVLDW